VATDIYELGATLLQMLTLSLPGSLPQVETESFGDCVKELNARAAAVVPVLRRCLAPDPANRFGSVKELLAALPA
jgi:serine/threonine protein kinase